MSEIESLPEEILTEIMMNLDPQSLLQFVLTSKTIYANFNESYLHYQLELRHDGLLDTLSGRPPADLLSDLRAFRVAWHNLEWRHATTIEVEWKLPLSINLQAGVLCVSSDSGVVVTPITSGDVIREPSPVDGDQEESASKTVKSNFDTTQDLQILVNRLEECHGELQFQTVSTAEPHPSAALAVLPFVGLDEDLDSAFHSLLINKNVVALCLFGTVAGGGYKFWLTLWDWHTGSLIYGSHELPDLLGQNPGYIRDFGFLSDTAFFLLREGQGDTGSILIYTFSSTTPPTLAKTFHLPAIHSHIYHISGIFNVSSPYQENRSKYLPFESDPECAIVVIMVNYRFPILPPTFEWQYLYFVHKRTLLQYTTSEKSNDLRWEDWGPKNTRVLAVQFLRSTRVQGQHVFIMLREDPYIYVFDFNANFKPELCTNEERKCDVFTNSDSPAVLKNNYYRSYPLLLWDSPQPYSPELFKNIGQLVTHLPCRVLEREIPEDSVRDFVDDTSLVTMEYDIDSGVGSLHHYSFLPV